MKAMRKQTALYMIGAAVLMAILAGCSVTVQPVVPVRDFQFLSSWQSGGKYISCEDRPTEIGYSFVVENTDQVAEWTETYYGVQSGETKTPRARTVGDAEILPGNRLYTQVAIPKNYMPLTAETDASFSPSAITVVPITSPTSKVGDTRLTVTVKLKSGFSYSGSYTYPVYGNCLSS